MTSITRQRPAQLCVVAALSLLFSACSFSGSFSVGTQTLDDLAVETIEDELAVENGLGEVTAICDSASGLEVGDTFDCTAVMTDGRIVHFETEIQTEEDIWVSSTNLLFADEAVDFVVQILNENNEGLNLTATDVDCGTEIFIWNLEEATSDRDCNVVLPSGEELPAILRYTTSSDFLEVVVS